MGKFVPRWSRWTAIDVDPPSAQMARQQACKTCKSPFAGFAGGLGGHSEISERLADRREPGITPESRSRGTLMAHRVEAMDLATFARAGLIVHMHSRILGRDVIFASDDVPYLGSTYGDESVFRASELRKLVILRPAPRTRQLIHDVRIIFHGDIIDVQEGDVHDRR